MENARDARRRKILERGSDRLALISGQVQSIPDSSPRAPNEGHPPPSGSPFSRVEGTSAHLTEQYKSGKDDKIAASEREGTHKHKAIPTTQASTEMVSTKMEHNNTVFELKPEVKELQRNNVTELCNTSVAQKSPDRGLDTALSARLMKHLTISSKQVSLVVSASENARLLCAFTIAIFTIIWSCLGGTIINFRPLFIVILADLTIGFWLLMANHGGDKQKTAKNEKLEYHWTGNVSDILEAWLIFQQVAGAIFMDCSICAVVMISALCIQIF